MCSPTAAEGYFLKAVIGNKGDIGQLEAPLLAAQQQPAENFPASEFGLIEFRVNVVEVVNELDPK